MFGDINLNELKLVMTSIGKNIAGSSDVFLKMDTDEFLMVYDEATRSASASILDYLADFAKDKNHPLRLNETSRVGYRQVSVPSKEVCKEGIYASPENFPLGEVELIGPASHPESWYKAVFSSPIFNGDIPVNLGGHAVHRVRDNIWTKILVVHYHWRCLEIDAKNSKRVVERHNYISPSDTDEAVLAKLTEKLGCGADEICDGSCKGLGLGWVGSCKVIQFNSYHKAVMVVKWLHCKEKIENDYYKLGGKGVFNQDLRDIWRISEEKFGL